MTAVGNLSARGPAERGPGADNSTPGFDVERVRKEFPILDRVVHGDKPLVYLDSANTSQKPTPVLDVMRAFYEQDNANVGRAVYELGSQATERYEAARERVAAFVGAGDAREIVFTKNASEAINLVAYSLGHRFGPGDEILITEMEHHSNIVPWQLLAERTGATLRWIPIDLAGRLVLDDLETLLSERTKIVAFVHQSNILGTLNPVDVLVRRAREVGAFVLLDASQSVPHKGVNVATLGVDFLVCTGHKMCGPTGIGVLWGRYELLAGMPPFLGGGSMIQTVEMARSTYADPPHRFEAGTPPIAQAIGLAAACDYLTDIGLDVIAAHEQMLTAHALERLRTVPGLRIIGTDTTADRGAAISFAIHGIHPHDVGQVLDDEHGVAVRVGHHCARPVCARFGVAATTRASFYLYNTISEVDTLVDGLHAVKRFFG